MSEPSDSEDEMARERRLQSGGGRPSTGGRLHETGLGFRGFRVQYPKP